MEAELILRVGRRGPHAAGQRRRSCGAATTTTPIGAVVVLNDVTRLKRLEAVRRDFVANVSHELKTPVTSIKGFAETLLDGALDDPEAARRFLRIIAGQADRLNAIIEDLLALSTLEAGQERPSARSRRPTSATSCSVAVEVVRAQGGRPSASRSRRTAPGEVFAAINPPLLEQAVVNLIDNAVKYSPEGSDGRRAASKSGPTRSSSASRDDGPGIAREHLPRLFERFYRVDKARSRDLGGTGLGLAIVKHIAQVHGGRVSVESALGRGSTFTHAPAARLTAARPTPRRSAHCRRPHLAAISRLANRPP